MSVGMPGYGKVFISKAEIFLSAMTFMESPFSWMVTPASLSLAITGRMWLVITFSTTILPPAAAAAIIKVPASILSGMIWCLQPWSFSTPFIFTMDVPAPLTSAPILFKKFAKSTISGSQAALSIIVSPSAKTAAIIIFCVAPTLGKSR